MTRRGGIVQSRRPGRNLSTVNFRGLMPVVGLGGVAAFLALAGLLSLGCSDDSEGGNHAQDAAQEAVCGNGIREEGEECDEGAENSDLRPNACRSDCRLPRCGDGVADDGEDCDGRDYADKTCQDLVDPTAPSDWPEAQRHFTGGHLACTEDCRLDLFGCTRCGNGIAEEGEECDGSDLANQDCASVANKQDGALSCTDNCTFDTSGCHTCGDGEVEEAEDCEPGQDLGVTCRDLGWSWGQVVCDPDTCRYDVSGCRSVCGNGRREPDEDCDRGDVGDMACGDLGFLGGELGCSAACRLDVSGCSLCGDGTLDSDFGEECDGTDLGGLRCQDLTGTGGSLGCTADCRLDLSGCVSSGTCGNGVVEEGEECDGTDLGNATCATVRGGIYGGGELSCTQDCTFDTTGCVPADHCGNGKLEEEFGEECDGTDLGSETCVGHGYGGGELGCNADCTLDFSGCIAGGTCGNGGVEEGEECDGTDLKGATCESLGFRGGELGCTSQCEYDVSGCDHCGNGVVDASGEECDGSDLNGASCESLGYSGGQLRCAVAGCRYDTTGCDTEVQLDLDNWQKAGCGTWEETAEGIRVCGSSYRQGNDFLSQQGYDFAGSTTYIKWKAEDTSYSGYAVCVGSCHPNGPRAAFTTDHSFQGSQVIESGTWYYTRIAVDQNLHFEAVTATGDFDDAGGQVYQTLTGSIQDSRLQAFVRRGHIRAALNDNYAGTGACFVIGSVATTARALGHGNQLASYDFEDGSVPQGLSPQGSNWEVDRTQGHDSASSFHVWGTGDSFLLLDPQGASAVEFWARFSRQSFYDYLGVWVGEDPFQWENVMAALRGADCWVHLRFVLPDLGPASQVRVGGNPSGVAGMDMWVDDITLYRPPGP